MPNPRKKTGTKAEDVPRIIATPTLDDHLDIMSRAIFQAGLNWAVIRAKWPAFRIAFEGFAVDRVSMYGEDDIERIMTTDGIIHSRKKIEATVRNARALQHLVRESGSIHAYAERFASYAELFTDAHTRFGFLGDLSCYYWLFRTSERVPPFEQWMLRQERDHPRMREMVTLAREAGVSPESDGR